MTPVETIIWEEISQKGAIGVDRYMELCLSHPQHGYYMTRDPFGASGDFTTAPEISQMFGEMIGLWVAQVWNDMGRPRAFDLIELGPGRGTLMKDVLRVVSKVPGFLDAANVALVETSPILKATQNATLQDHKVAWSDSIDGFGGRPGIWLANEFFDALPVRQFQKIGDVWMERVVKTDNRTLVYGLAKTEADGLNLAEPDGTVLERAEAGMRLMGKIGQSIEASHGAALIFDYGDVEGRGTTLQAVRNHESVDIFDAPGEADLTAHVQFSDLAASAQPCHSSLTTQGQFLKALGIEKRAADLQAKGGRSVQEALHRLTAREEMGSLFKVMAVTHRNAPKPLGF